MHKPYYTSRCKEDRFYCSSGSKLVDKVQLSKDERGNHKVVVVGQVDLFEQIQSYKDGCDIHKIVARYNVTGEPLPIDPNCFGGSIPTTLNLRDMNATISKARQIYEKAPQSVVKKYPTFESFLDVFGDNSRFNEVCDIMGIKIPKTKENGSQTVSEPLEKVGDVNAKS